MVRHPLLIAGLLAALVSPLRAGDLTGVPTLPHRLVPDWAKLPSGWSLGEASGVSVDANDHVWVFNRGAHPVVEFDKTGKFIQAWKDVPVVSAHGIKVDGDGNVWVVDVKGHAVIKCDRSGQVKMVITNAGRTPGDNETLYAFNQPTGLSFLPNGDFYVSDGYGNSRVIQYTRNGDFVRKWGRKGTGDGEFDLVHDVVAGADGRVYVADRTNERIQVFDQQGKFLAKWSGFGSPWGLAYSDKEKAVYMCDGKNNRVVKVSLDGKVLGTLGTFGKGPGRFDFAHHMAIDSEGSLYVVEIKNWRVQKFSAR